MISQFYCINTVQNCPIQQIIVSVSSKGGKDVKGKNDHGLERGEGYRGLAGLLLTMQLPNGSYQDL